MKSAELDAHMYDSVGNCVTHANLTTISPCPPPPKNTPTQATDVQTDELTKAMAAMTISKVYHKTVEWENEHKFPEDDGEIVDKPPTRKRKFNQA